MANPNVYTISIGPLCKSGGQHALVTVTVNSGAIVFSEEFTVDEIAGVNNELDPRQVLLIRLRSFYKEGGYATLGAFKTAAEAYTFKI